MPTNDSSKFIGQIETLKEIYSALNRNDLTAIFEHFDSQIVRVETFGFPSDDTYRSRS